MIIAQDEHVCYNMLYGVILSVVNIMCIHVIMEFPVCAHGPNRGHILLAKLVYLVKNNIFSQILNIFPNYSGKSLARHANTSPSIINIWKRNSHAWMLGKFVELLQVRLIIHVISLEKTYKSISHTVADLSVFLFLFQCAYMKCRECYVHAQWVWLNWSLHR